jgi:alpha-L-fucosidase
MFETDLAAGARVSWQRTGERAAIAEIDLGRLATVAIARLEEDITKGQMIAAYTLTGSDGGEWRTLAKGTTIGYARLDRFEPVSLRRVRVSIDDAVAPPVPVRIKLF